MMRVALYVVAFILAGHLSLAQTGAVKGDAWDSARATSLGSATVAVYRVNDTVLVTYALSDNKGYFSLHRLPLGMPLELVVSFVGYKSMVKRFRLTPTDTSLEMGHINMPRSTGELEEVVINGVPPPIRMKGDTLEFNADAFKLDPNAQTEDLLRALPGVTVWADGVITVNGREVSSVLVNGKPFFGGSAKVATQNIPKGIVDKVQVYQRGSGTVQADSTTEMNIKLKKGKGVGYFGKISGGYGTGNRYDADGSLNFFNSSTQLSVAGVSNNVNKIANNMSFLLGQQTFKGPGASVEYQSDFTIPGVTTFNAGGLQFQHDFLANPNYWNSDRVTGEYYVNDNRQYLVNNTQTLTTLNDTSHFTTVDRNTSSNHLVNQRATVLYGKRKNGYDFSLSSYFNDQMANNQHQDSAVMNNEEQRVLSTNTQSENLHENTRDLGVNAHFGHQPDNVQPLRALSNYTIDWVFESLNDRKKEDLRSVYLGIDSPGVNTSLTRRYDDLQTKQVNKLNMAAPDLVSGGRLHGFDIGLRNDLEIDVDGQNNQVKDKDSSLDVYEVNPYLTNIRRDETYSVKPALTLNKIIHIQAPRGYTRQFSTDFSAGPQFYTLHSSSQKEFQQFSREYSKPVGTAGIKYEDTRTNVYSNSIRLEVTASSLYPTVDQLAPLVDSSNLNSIQTGNPYLEEQDTREVGLIFAHMGLGPRNTLTSYLRLLGGYIDNYIAGSNHIDSLGRVVNSLVNASGYRYGGFNGDLKKAYKWRKNQLQLSISPTASWNKTPIYINGVSNHFSNISLVYNPGILYTYGDLLAVNLANVGNYSWYIQKGPTGSSTNSVVEQIQLSAYINCTKKLSVGSNVTYTDNTFNGTREANFTIWNAHVAYRMFKGNDAEIRFSALDLLHQNKGIVNFGNTNSVTHGQSNVLEQYFMLSFSWYLRKFGK